MKNQTRLISLLLVILLFLFSIPLVHADTTTSAIGNVLTITMLNQEPDPVRPGQYVIARFRIENKGIQGGLLQTELLADSPVKILDSKIKQLGSLRGASGTDAVAIEWKLRIDDNAAAGDIPLKVRYWIDDSAAIIATGFTIHVRPATATLRVEHVDLTPAQFSPGNSGIVNITLLNSGTSTVRNVRIALDLTNTPYVPLYTSSDSYINVLETGMAATTQLALQVQPDAKAKPYRIPATLSFEDQSGTLYSTNTSIGIPVGGLPNIQVFLQSTDVITADSTGRVVLQVVNTGLLDARFVTVTLEQGDYTLLSPIRSYAGDISPDDFATADFKLHISSTKKNSEPSSSVVLHAIVSYATNANEHVEKSFDIPLRIYTTTDAAQFGLISKSSAPWWIAAIIVILGVIGYVYWRKRK